LKNLWNPDEEAQQKAFQYGKTIAGF